ncbi:NADH-quinone oxidoreductase subunit NuoE [Pseudoalteromonas denitrificans]|uniref:NADH-quinone oxidoreductase subunit E n=1 Tax=Pseudoalteromonas denitrificans DSM 6059 TaxID=1123010 RepID=A0A1I1P2Y7_9GAMM|nr:NADH-quinone oxidoreductase subunit NuoE [Pseudoalteromonas denitrificans]SFD04179.1 NADH dehydrogenase subunit E [Pseudoalteromonas denitrificans DSM 6059]
MTLQLEIPTNEVVELSDVEKKQIDALLQETLYVSGASIDALKIIQNHRGWVSNASLLALSKYINLPLADLDSVATFYNLIFRQPVGKHVLHPCDGISCDLMGGKKIRQCLKKQLKINNGETTRDNLFTLLPLPCLGACDKAPVMIANKQLFELLEEKSLPSILNHLQQEHAK